MFHHTASLFDDASLGGDESLLLLDDLETLVALGLLEERRSPDGPVFALTDLGEQVPEFAASTGRVRYK
jgi:hypothetical protein